MSEQNSKMLAFVLMATFNLHNVEIEDIELKSIVQKAGEFTFRVISGLCNF